MSPLDRVIRFCLDNKLVVVLMILFLVAWGILVAPFDWKMDGLPRDPVPVDAIPDTGENQQIVFTDWPGRSPQDVEDQITYPMTVALLGVPGVKSIRSNSMFGFSSVFVIFKEDVEFYWSRSRILEKLNSLPAGTLPAGVQPALGPDATPLGQVFWYTLEGRDDQGRSTGGWGLHQLRTIQDWYVRYSLSSVEGVAEVASIGGFVQEYQIDVDPDSMRSYGVTLDQVFQAVRASNLDVGARTIEINRAEYVVRGLGFIKSTNDIEETVVRVRDNVPITVKQIGRVSLGPALRRGALDKGGNEAVGGVIVVRYGANPLAVIQRVKAKIAEIGAGLPRKTMDDGTVSRVTIVPFYDRTGLIYETLGTLNNALYEEILVSVIVVLVLMGHFRSAVLISGLLPLAVLMCFIAMKLFGVDANIVALSGIAIAIGTMVDMGIVISENILKHVSDGDTPRQRWEAIFRGTSEVGSAVLTAVLTTVVSFLPVFTMEGAEGKLFKPLAFTKTFALLASIVVALTIIPPMAHLLLRPRASERPRSAVWRATLWRFGAPLALGILLCVFTRWWIGAIVLVLGLWRASQPYLPVGFVKWAPRLLTLMTAVIFGVWLSQDWAPIGPGRDLHNVVFVIGLLAGMLLIFWGFQRIYAPVLRFCLDHKLLFLCAPATLVLLGVTVWFGFERVFWFLPRAVAALPASWIGEDGQDDVTADDVRRMRFWVRSTEAMPGLGKEFMPSLDEGSFLLMPITMAHASIGESLELLQQQDMLIQSIPEVDMVVGKIGRAESPLDPAPIGMVETVINYKPEYITDEDGRRKRFRWDAKKRDFARDAGGELIADPDGRPFRQWRPHIRSPDDIWKEIENAAAITGMTRASALQPIETRRIMLQTGMRATLGVKVFGPDLATVERVGLEIERLLKEIPSVRPETVIADRIVGKPYLEIDIDRRAIARYGLTVRRVQDVIEVAIGGKRLTTTVEGRERYPVRVRYLRELRDQIETLEKVLVAAPDGTQIPLGQIAKVRYAPGPQSIKSEDTFLVGYVLFDKVPERAEVDVVEECQEFLAAKIEAGELQLPRGVRYRFAGAYENQVRATKKLRVVLPLALFLIFLILYFQFRSVATTLIVFSGVFVAWAGGFVLLWLYGQGWFMDFEVFHSNMRDLFQMHTINLSVAVWVGFLALFGIATDDGVLIATYIKQQMGRSTPGSRAEIRSAVIAAGRRRIRPAMMTTATTVLALIPVLTATGRGADVMVPMAIPSVGGMVVAMITVFVVPTLCCAVAECRLKASMP